MIANYNDTLYKLFAATSTPRLGLARMQELMLRLGNPEKQFASLHVAGTNGKGSTCAFLDAILRSSNYRVGLYTSPHLSCARERVQINGSLISEKTFCELADEVFSAVQKMSDAPSFFEQMTAIGFLAFAYANVDVAVIEVGLGGRLDATNVITPVACGITAIGLDHMQFLGESVAQIAEEKAGIIKPFVPVAVMNQAPEILDVICQRANTLQAPVVFAEIIDLPMAMRGVHQQLNLSVAVNMLRQSGLAISDEAIRNGAQNVRWPARYERIAHMPDVIIDGAHNTHGLHALIATLRDDVDLRGKKLVAVFGLTSGHHENEMGACLRTLGERLHCVIATQARAPRALQVDVVAQAVRAEHSIASVHDAVAKAQQIARDIDGAVVVAGSLYVAGEARAAFIDVPVDPQLPMY